MKSRVSFSIVCAAAIALMFAGGAAASDPLTPEVSSGELYYLVTGSLRQEVEQVDPAILTCDGVITFDDVPGGPAPGTNYDAIFESDGADFAERFVGQILSYNGDFDVLSGAPTGPLAPYAGNPTENLSVYDHFGGPDGQILTGNGPVGWPDYGAIGEGSFAVLFDFDQSEFGFDIVGQDGGGYLYISFFKRDGTLIDMHTIATGGGDVPYGFRRVGGIQDIAGITLHNDDPAGVGFDNLCHDVPGIPGAATFLDIKPTSCPNPLNVKSKGVLPAAILGTETFDVTTVDPATIALEGVPLLRYGYEDVTTPVAPGGEPCDCTEEGPDGYEDMTLKFRTQEIVAALGDYEDGDVLELTLTAELMDGTPLELHDCVWILDKTKQEIAMMLSEPAGSDLKPASERSWGTIKALYR